MNLGKNLFWRIMQQYSVYIIKLLVQVLLARVLGAGDFGVIGIVLVFSSIAEIIAVSGLGTALVQKINPDEDDYSTVLCFSFIIALFVYIVLFFSAPIISSFYAIVELIKLIRIYSIIVFFQSYLAVINAYVQKKSLFEKSFWGNLIAVVLSGIVSVVLAYQGFGVWSLVVYSLLAAFISIVIIQVLIRWHPKIGFKTSRFKPLFSFSWKVLVSSLIGTFLENIYNLTIGKYYGKETLGYYKQGNTYPDAILGQTRTAFSAVMLPAYASLQNNTSRLKESILQMTHTITLMIFPMAFGLAAIARTFVLVVLTEKWLPAVFFLRLECVFYGTLPITTSLGNGMIAVGRSDISAKIEFSKLLATILCVVLFHAHGVTIICVARVVVAVVFIAVSAIISHRVLSLSYLELLKSIIKPLLFSSIMGVCVFASSFINGNQILVLVIELFIGAFVYGLLVFSFMKDDIKYLMCLFKNRG